MDYSQAPTLFESVSHLALLVGMGVGIGAVLKSCVYSVKQNTVAILETFGKASSPTGAGLHFKLPSPIQKVAHRVSLARHEFNPEVKVKTSDDVFVDLPTAIQYEVTDPLTYVYKVKDAQKQIASYILQSIRTTASGMTMAELYENKDKIRDNIQDQLKEKMAEYGVNIDNVLIDQPVPPKEVQDKFNRVIGAKREVEAAKLEGEALYLRKVKEAEAEKAAAKLAGEGLRDQRTAILEGLKENFQNLRSADVSTEQAWGLIGLSMQVEGNREMAKFGNLILAPSNPAGNTAPLAEMLTAFSAVNGNRPQRQAQAATPS